MTHQDREALTIDKVLSDKLRDANEEICALRERAEAAERLVNDCAEYLKEGETPRQRMDRDNKDILALMQLLHDEKVKVEALRSFKERAREVMEPFADFAKNNVDADGWAGLTCQNDRIVDWFGPSEFRSLAALYRGLSADDSPMAADGERKSRQLEWRDWTTHNYREGCGDIWFNGRCIGDVQEDEGDFIVSFGSAAQTSWMIFDDAKNELFRLSRDWLGLPDPRSSNGEVAG